MLTRMSITPKRMRALAPVGFLLLVAGCDSSAYQRAARLDTRDAYLRYLARYPDGDHAEAATRRLEDLVFRAARQADRPLGYRMYLEHHPHGRHASACRLRLAKLALARARTPPDLLLITNRYPGTPEAAEAAKRHPKLLAEHVLAHRDPSLCRRFLDLYPGRTEALKIRTHLAGLLYPRLVDDQAALESFAQEFGGTKHGGQALSRLETLLIEEVRQSRSQRSLRQLQSRFPRSPALRQLQLLVRKHEIENALIELNIDALEALATGEGEDLGDARMALRWCRLHASRCASMQMLARRAGPWLPGMSLKQLQRQSYSPVMETAWKAIQSLGWIALPTAGDHLLELISSQRLSSVWIATVALETWLKRKRDAERKRWIAMALKRSYRKTNEDEVQRRGYLCLLADRTLEGRALLEGLMQRPGRMLTASYLLARREERTQGTISRPILGRLVASARARVKWLEQAFPEELHQDSLVAATLAERELFALKRALQGFSAPAAGLVDVKGDAKELLSRWRARLIKVSKDFRPAQQIDLEHEVRRHEQGRGAALHELGRQRSPLAKMVQGAICRRYPHHACAGLTPPR